MTTANRELEALRETASKTLIVLLWLHVPVAAAIGMLRGADWTMPTLFTMVLAAAARLSWRTAGNGLSTRLIVSVAAMGGDDRVAKWLRKIGCAASAPLTADFSRTSTSR